jgi:DNA-binding transcriptional regulator YdaS (Cro superfamily)
MEQKIENSPIGLDGLNKAIDLIGLAGVAKAINRNYQVVQSMRKAKTICIRDPLQCKSIVEATGGQVSFGELRPDLVEVFDIRAPLIHLDNG